MRVASVFFPRFPVQRRVLEQPSLAGRPLILHRDERGSQRVIFASGTALKRGLRPGMTVAAAAAIDPTVVRLPFEPAAEVAALQSLGETLLTLAPAFQVDGPEGLWLDASAAPLAGSEALLATRVLEVCRGLGLQGRCVVASERFTAQALARHGVGQTIGVVGPRGGAELARLPLSCLEHGWLGAGAAAPFQALGLTTLGELTGLAPSALVARFGAVGLQAARLCRGEDDSLFLPDVLPELIEEAVQLDWPAEHLEPVLFALKMALDRVCARLQGRQQAAVRLTVTVGLAGAAPLLVPLLLARPSSQGRTLLELARHRLTDLTVRNPIVSLSVRIEEATADAGRQLVLGDTPAGEAALEVVLSRLQSALGEAALFGARPEATHRPEASWSAVKFSPPPVGTSVWGTLATRPPAPERVEAELELVAPPPAPAPAEPGAPKPWPRKKAKTELRPVLSRPAMSTRPPRLFKAPARLFAELTQAGALVSMQVAGQRRRVESVWGPERLVGAWWEDGYARDYYRVQLEGVGTLWVFRDGQDGAFYAQGVFD